MANLTQERRRALRMLEGSPSGRSESIMLAHGFTAGVLDGLVRDGFATMQPSVSRDEIGLTIVAWMQITDAGRETLAL
jgi:hypothetical protein